jgi:pimeloyl-ACP methyl ester carboxylesterase
VPRLEHRRLPGAGVTLSVVLAGPADGRPVVLLHGFPEFWYEWRKQIGPLAAAGFRVIVPDQRGYNRSDKPADPAAYTTDILADDVVGCLDALGVRRAAVVGHDWGGGVGWWLAHRHPDRVSRLVVMNCPHPTAMEALLEGDVGQLARSWYIFAAQVPGLPEAVARWTDFGVLTRALRLSSRPGTFTAEELHRYRRAWARPGAVRGMVNWYRAAARYTPQLPPGRVRVPTLLLWGCRDAALKRELAPLSAAMCEDVRLVEFPDATHWLPHEEPDAVNRLVVGFLGGRTGEPVARAPGRESEG